MSIKKYRPYFTFLELKTIIQKLKESSNPPVGIITYLEKYTADIEHSRLQESIILKPSLTDRLELLDIKESDMSNPHIKTPVMLYADFLQHNKQFTYFTGVQIESIKQYMYENDLMSESEEIEYEKNLGITS